MQSQHPKNPHKKEPIRHRHRVCFYETDAMGVVHHSNYLRFFEEARMHWYLQRDISRHDVINGEKINFAVVEAQAKYKSPARYTDELEVTVYLRQERSVIRFEYLVTAVEDARVVATRLFGSRTRHCANESLSNLSRFKLYPQGGTMDRNLALEFVRITEAAALASARFMGRGDEKAADQAAVDAMRRAFDRLRIDGTVVIGEGERDEAPMLYIGEKVGESTKDAPKIDIALDPLEGTSICARGGSGATSVIAVADQGNFLHAPDTYMDKIAVGSGARGKVNLDWTPTRNVQAVALALGKSIDDVTVAILNRPRHEQLIREVRSTGARIRLIGDGDVSAAIATGWGDAGIDMLLGIGGAPEGVISAAAMKCLDGDFQGRLKFRNDEERARATKMGVTDLDKLYQRDEIAKGSVMFCASGVTDGPLLKGVRFKPGRHAETHSIVMRSSTRTIRTINAFHQLDLKP